MSKFQPFQLVSGFSLGELLAKHLTSEGAAAVAEFLAEKRSYHLQESLNLDAIGELESNSGYREQFLSVFTDDVVKGIEAKSPPLEKCPVQFDDLN